MPGLKATKPHNVAYGPHIHMRILTPERKGCTTVNNAVCMFTPDFRS